MPIPAHPFLSCSSVFGELVAQALALLALTALAAGLALLVGAADLGTALGIGELAFVGGLVYVLVRA